MDNLLVIVPSRGRPQNAERLLSAWTQTEATADLLFAVDDDDPTLGQYLELTENVYVGPRIKIGPTLNVVASKYASEYEAIGFMGDDHLPRTPRWDSILMNTLNEFGTGIVYGNDLLQGETIPTAVFMTSDIVRVLGYFCPPKLLHMYLDNAWKEWGLGGECLKYLPDVIIEHMHPGNGKAQFDSIYNESGGLTAVDQMNYKIYYENDLEGDVAKIKGLRV